MEKDHSDSETEESRCRHYMAYSFRLAARDLLYPTDRVAHTTAFGNVSIDIHNTDKKYYSTSPLK